MSLYLIKHLINDKCFISCQKKTHTNKVKGLSIKHHCTCSIIDLVIGQWAFELLWFLNDYYSLVAIHYKNSVFAALS